VCGEGNDLEEPAARRVRVLGESLLSPLIELNLQWDDYPLEPLPYDATFLHAIDRLLPLTLRAGTSARGYHQRDRRNPMKIAIVGGAPIEWPEPAFRGRFDLDIRR
jgi:hypothetical protein